MNVFEAILGMRAIREYTAEQVDAKKVRSLIEAAVMAPIAIHREAWAFTIIQDVGLLQRLSDATKLLVIEQHKQDHAYDIARFKTPAFNIFYGANLLIVICKHKDEPMAIADCWLAAENVMLAAFAMGLGSCVIESALLALNDKEQKISFGITDGFEAVVPIVVGYTRANRVSTRRKRPLILNWFKTKTV
jgi:nitroreductase